LSTAFGAPAAPVRTAAFAVLTSITGSRLHKYQPPAAITARKTMRAIQRPGRLPPPRASRSIFSDASSSFRFVVT
jgi:hypothetical protein